MKKAAPKKDSKKVSDGAALSSPSTKKSEASATKPRDGIQASTTKRSASATAGSTSPKPRESGLAQQPIGSGSGQAELNIGMIGHVDHGKTTLTEKLTGKWTDTHSEEIKRGISIRLGYADIVFRKCPTCSAPECFTTALKCPSCGKETEVLRKVSFVDAPGHETLMTTMLSGAALMQGAVLVIAANEPVPQPRTAEHVMALELSNVKHIVVAQNKVDLVSREKAFENFQQINAFLKEYGFENAHVIPVSANFGANLDLLMEAINSEIPTPEFELNKPLKMFVARSFDINKPGTKVEDFKGGVLGGSIVQGTVKVGDAIEISPGFDGKKLVTKVESLSTSFGKLQEAKPGGLIGIGTQLDPSICRNDQFRGQLAAKPGTLPAPTQRMKLEVEYLKRLLNVEVSPYKMNEIALVSVGTMTAVGNVVSSRNNVIEVLLKNNAIVDKGQKAALSKKIGASWRLVGYGTVA